MDIIKIVEASYHTEQASVDLFSASSHIIADIKDKNKELKAQGATKGKLVLSAVEIALVEGFQDWDDIKPAAKHMYAALKELYQAFKSEAASSEDLRKIKAAREAFKNKSETTGKENTTGDNPDKNDPQQPGNPTVTETDITPKGTNQTTTDTRKNDTGKGAPENTQL